MQISTIDKMQSRSLLLFKNSLKSPETFKTYHYYVDKFLEFCKIDSYDDAVKMNPEKIQILLEDYIMVLKDRLNPNSVPTFFYPLQTFFEVNDIELKWKRIRRLFPAKVKSVGNLGYTSEDIQKMLECTASLRNKALIHFLASSGMRLGAIEDLKVRHLSKMPRGCKSILVYEGSLEEYTTFLTPEASEFLEKYFEHRRNDLEKITSESPIFRTNYSVKGEKVERMSTKAIEMIIKRISNKIQIENPRKGIRFRKPLVHAFRKRFNTVLKMEATINPVITEKLMGHVNGLEKSYLCPTKEELFLEFEKGIIVLTIDRKEKIKRENQKLENEIISLRLKEEQNQKLKDRFLSLEKKNEDLSSKYTKLQKMILDILKQQKIIP